MALIDAGQTGNTTEAKAALLCTGAKEGALFALGSESGSSEEDDSGLDVPFGINVGQAIGYEGGFAVAAVDGRAGKSHAILAVMGPNAENGRKLDLGRVYGDADPPAIAGDSRNLLVAIADMDAAGRTLRLLRVEDTTGLAKVINGPDLSVGESSSSTFSIAVNGEHGIVTWVEPDKKTEVEQVVLAHFGVQSLALPKKPMIVSSAKSEAESPRVVSRPGGFWLGWVQSTPQKAGDRGSKNGNIASSRPSEKKGPEDDLGLPAVDLGVRELYVSSLDPEARPVFGPLRVTEGASHAVSFEIATLGDGSAVITWRDDDTSPGVQAPLVHVARVGLDGHVERFRIEDESIGVGEPQLLVDSTAAEEDRAWLAIGNTGEKVSIVRLLPNANPQLPIVDDTDIGVSYPLVRFGGALLVARQRGPSVDLEPLRCRFGKR